MEINASVFIQLRENRQAIALMNFAESEALPQPPDTLSPAIIKADADAVVLAHIHWHFMAQPTFP